MPSLIQRIVVAAVGLLAVTALVVLGFSSLGLLGLELSTQAAIGRFVMVAVSVFVATMLAVAIGPGAVVLFLIGLVLFSVVLAAVLSPIVAALAVLAFLLLVSIAVLLQGVGTTPRMLAIRLAALVLLPIVALVLGQITAGTALMAVAAIGLTAVVVGYLWLTLRYHRLPLAAVGLGGLASMPAIPFRVFPDLPDTVVKLKTKEQQEEVAKNGLTAQFTLGTGSAHQRTATARTFLYGTGEERSYSLDTPDQFSIAWTTFGGVGTRAAPLAAVFASALTDPDVATREFWPTLTRYYTAFGPVPMRRVLGNERAAFVASGVPWAAAMDALLDSGNLYVIDLRIFGMVDPPSVAVPRFTPATLTFLARADDADGVAAFTPILIQVSSGPLSAPAAGPVAGAVTAGPGNITRTYRPGAPGTVAGSTWLYALVAAKTGLTAWGIWLGHVYRLHLVTAAMQMTMFQLLADGHPVRQLLGRQSKYLIGFDVVLLLDWSFPPPTSMATAIHFLRLADTFSSQPPSPGLGRPRNFGDDDPTTGLLTLQGHTPREFTRPVIVWSDILAAFVARLRAGADTVSNGLVASLSPATQALLADSTSSLRALQNALAADLDGLLDGGSDIYDPTAAGIVVSAATAAEPAGRRRNRLLLEDAYPNELAPMDWNQYPVARYLLWLFRMAGTYVTAVVGAYYANNAAVAADAALADWMTASGTTGNVRGLPPATAATPLTVAGLTSVLTSLIYRITAHGVARLLPVGHPGLSFAGNFPPCLEDSRLPDPDNPNRDAPSPTPLTPAQLLVMMPKTGTIGEMFAFIAGFVFTNPYEPLIPESVTNPDTAGGDPRLAPFTGAGAAVSNAALAAFVAELRRFIEFFLADQTRLNAPADMNFQATPAQIHNWELHIET